MFCGRVLDGPFEGDWIEEDEPYFVGHLQQQLGAVTSYGADIPPVEFEIDRAYYQWLHGYGAWAWMQPGARRTK
jgi:hypothetical protein